MNSMQSSEGASHNSGWGGFDFYGLRSISDQNNHNTDILFVLFYKLNTVVHCTSEYTGLTN